MSNFNSSNFFYGNATQPKAMNSIMAKRLQGGGQQFFDSGDYNMAQNRKPMGAFPPAFQKKPPLPKNISESGELRIFSKKV